MQTLYDVQLRLSAIFFAVYVVLVVGVPLCLLVHAFYRWLVRRSRGAVRVGVTFRDSVTGEEVYYWVRPDGEVIAVTLSYTLDQSR